MLVDIHPLSLMLESTDPLAFDFPYASTGGASTTRPGSYAAPGPGGRRDRDRRVRPLARRDRHAALGAGLRIEHLEEHLDADFDARGRFLSQEDDGRFRLRLDGEVLPVEFTLIARRP